MSLPIIQPISLALNNLELLKHVLYKDYQFPSEVGNLNRTHERILMTIKYCPELTMVNISRAIGIEKGPFSQSVDKLEYLNLVKRVRSNIDKRNIHLQLTTQGISLTQVIENSMESHFETSLQKLTKEQQLDLFNALETIKQLSEIISSK